MEEREIADGSKAAVAIDEASVGSIGSQTFFGHNYLGLFEYIEHFKEVKNPV